jgi:ParB-like chromosome segregation protein Spo0J
MADLVASLAAEGQLTPVQVLPPDSSGRFTLRSGHRRVRALRQLSRLFVNAEVVAPAPSLLAEYRQARAINVQHRSHSLFDDALRFSELLAQGVVSSQVELATLAGMRASELSKLLSIAELGLDLLEQMAAKPEAFGLTTAYLIYGHWKGHGRSAESAAALIKKVAQEGLSVREVTRLVALSAGRTEQPLRRGRALSRASLQGPGKGDLKVFEERLSFEIEQVDPTSRDQLFSRLVKFFEANGFAVQAVSAAEHPPSGQLSGS